MSTLIVKSMPFGGPYAEYDEDTDTMIATEGYLPKPEQWIAVSGEPDIDLGVITSQEEVCIDRCCDEWEMQTINRQVALRVRNVKFRNLDWDCGKTVILNMGKCIDITLINIVRHGQLALQGNAWWPIIKKI